MMVVQLCECMKNTDLNDLCAMEMISIHKHFGLSGGKSNARFLPINIMFSLVLKVIS